MPTSPSSRPATERLGALRQAAQDARQAAARLRDRARTGDGLVTPREIVEADAAIELSDLRLEQAEETARAEQEAERRAANDRAADAYLKAERGLEADMIDAASEVRQAMARLGQLAERHAQVLAAADVAAAGAPEDYRLRSDMVGTRLDGRRLPSPMDGPAWLFRIYAEMTGQRTGIDPALWPVTAQATKETTR